MKYRQVFLPVLCACAFAMLCAFKFWNARSILVSSPWTSVETWNDFDEDGVFVLDTVTCQQDDNWTFSLNGNLMISEDSISCEPEMPESNLIAAFWTLENYETLLKISFTNGGAWVAMTLYSIGPNEVVLHYTGTEDPNDTVIRQHIILRR